GTFDHAEAVLARRQAAGDLVSLAALGRLQDQRAGVLAVDDHVEVVRTRVVVERERQRGAAEIAGDFSGRPGYPGRARVAEIDAAEVADVLVARLDLGGGRRGAGVQQTG